MGRYSEESAVPPIVRCLAMNALRKIQSAPAWSALKELAGIIIRIKVLRQDGIYTSPNPSLKKEGGPIVLPLNKGELEGVKKE